MNELKKKITSLISEYFENKNSEFVPGTTPILTGMSVYDANEVNAIIGSVLDGWFGLGKSGQEFENRFSAKVGKSHSVYVNSGSSANLLALLGLKNKLGLSGGEIITTACTFPTTLNPIIQLGFKPHFVDVDETLNITPESVSAAINKNTKGVMFAHTLGNPARVEEIVDIAKKNGLFVVEDCCDALGASYKGRACGTFGDVATFSFYPAHIITTGEGGMVSTDDKALSRITKSLRDWGRDCWCATDEKNPLGACGCRFDFKVDGVSYDHKYIYSQIGYNMKPLELQAAMGLKQLDRLDAFVRIRKRNFGIYSERFQRFKDHLSLPDVSNGADPVFFGLPVTITNDRIDRTNLVRYLNDNKIATRYLFGGNTIRQPAYKGIEYASTGKLLRSDVLFHRFFWIGIHQGMDERMVTYVCDKFDEYIRKSYV